MKDFYIHYNYSTATTPFGLFFFIGCVLNLPFSCSFRASVCVFFWTLAWFKKSFLLIRWYPFYLLLLLPWFLGWICDDWLLLGDYFKTSFFSLLNLAEELCPHAEIVFFVSLVTDIFSFQLLKTVGERTGLGYSFFFFFLKSGNSTFSLKLPWFLCQSNRFGQAVQELDFLVSTTAERVAKKRGLETREDL